MTISTRRQSTFRARFAEAMNDDFNTPVAISVLFDLAREINRQRESGVEAGNLAGLLVELGGVLGILQSDPEQYLQADTQAASGLSAEKIAALIEARNAARAQRQWREADRIRDELSAAGVVLEDGPNGTTWRRL